MACSGNGQARWRVSERRKVGEHRIKNRVKPPKNWKSSAVGYAVPTRQSRRAEKLKAHYASVRERFAVPRRVQRQIARDLKPKR